MRLQLRRIRLPLAAFPLVVDTELTSRVTAVFGPSGAGKTSLLDLLAGLRRPESAFIQFDNDVWTDSDRGVSVPPRHRRLGYVPQDGALFPHLSVRQNLVYSRRPPTAAPAPFSLTQITELLELEPLLERRVPTLSGGERQRVALARALLSSPRLLLLDEPLAGLDLILRARALGYLERIRDACGVPMLHVTHNLSEAMALGEHLLVLQQGRIVQAGRPLDVVTAPETVAIARAVGTENLFVGTVCAQDPAAGTTTIEVGGGRLEIGHVALPLGATVTVGLRSEDIIVARERLTQTSARNVIAGTIRALRREAGTTELTVAAGVDFRVSLTAGTVQALELGVGTAVFLLIKARAFHRLE